MAHRTVVPDIASLSSMLGKEVGPSDWIEITQERVDAFARATGDHQWIHVDPERAARESPFGGPIAHGYLTLSMSTQLLLSVLEVKGAGFMVNPGLEKLRLRAPVKVGDRIRMRASIKKVRPIADGAARVTFHFVVEIAGSARPAAHADAFIVFYP